MAFVLVAWLPSAARADDDRWLFVGGGAGVVAFGTITPLIIALLDSRPLMAVPVLGPIDHLIDVAGNDCPSSSPEGYCGIGKGFIIFFDGLSAAVQTAGLVMIGYGVALLLGAGGGNASGVEVGLVQPAARGQSPVGGLTLAF